MMSDEESLSGFTRFGYQSREESETMRLTEAMRF